MKVLLYNDNFTQLPVNARHAFLLSRFPYYEASVRLHLEWNALGADVILRLSPALGGFAVRTKHC